MTAVPAVPTVRDDGTTAVIEWLETTMGGKVLSIKRQARWRPVWIVDLETDDAMLPLMVRGERSDNDMTWSLDHEMRFQRLMHDNGIKVPAVYGWIDAPTAMVTDRYPGRSDFATITDADRDRVVDEYVQELVRLHSLAVEPWVAAGIDRAGEGEDPATVGMIRMEDMYRRQKVRWDPLLEFFLGWWHRNAPLAHDREGPIVWDSGQLMHDDGHLVGIIDVELGHIGDPMMDLAGWRMRDSILPFGDFHAIYDRYGQLAGRPVDLEAIQLHHIAFTISNQLAFSHALLDPPPESDFATNLQWCNETNLYATEGLAEYLGVELPTVEMPEARQTTATTAFGHLVRFLGSARVDDDYLAYRMRGAFRMARHLARNDEIGDAVLAANLDDVHQLLDVRYDTWPEAEVALERYVLDQNADGSQDEALVVHFHKRNLRLQMLNGPAGSAMARHNPIQPFRR